MKKNVYLSLFIAINVLAFIAVIVLVKTSGTQAFDDKMYQTFMRAFSPVEVPFWSGISNMASAPVLVGLSIVVAAAWWYYKKRVDLFGVAAIAVAYVLNYIIKHVVARPRPGDHQLIVEAGMGFPSAHAMVGAAFYGLVMYYICKSKQSKAFKIVACAFMSFLIFTIGVSRIILGVHYTSDIIGGYFAGIAIAIAVAFVRETLEERKNY